MKGSEDVTANYTLTTKTPGTLKIFDRTNKFAGYMTRSSFGIYIVHYFVIASFGYMLKVHTQLPPLAIYLILTIAVFTLSPLIYEGLRRSPFLSWCIFGEKHPHRERSLKKNE